MPAPVAKGGEAKLTDAQRDLIVRMGFVRDALRNGDELRPMWWLEGRPGGVKANVAKSLIRLGYVRFTGKWGGHPGILGFTVTRSGREALARAESRPSPSTDTE